MADIWEILRKQDEPKEGKESVDELKDPFFEEEVEKTLDNI